MLQKIMKSAPPDEGGILKRNPNILNFIVKLPVSLVTLSLMLCPSSSKATEIPTNQLLENFGKTFVDRMNSNFQPWADGTEAMPNLGENISNIVVNQGVSPSDLEPFKLAMLSGQLFLDFANLKMQTWQCYTISPAPCAEFENLYYRLFGYAAVFEFENWVVLNPNVPIKLKKQFIADSLSAYSFYPAVSDKFKLPARVLAFESSKTGPDLSMLADAIQRNAFKDTSG